jgi:tRNA dimethylallyltransferase
MESARSLNSEPLLIIVGPTASGKTSLGVAVAEMLGGEIVSADAFAIYRGLDIGTDTPDEQTRRAIPHHLIDIADPSTQFSAGDFITKADQAIEEIRRRNRTPVVVGGSHFYVRALLLGLFPAQPRDVQVSAELAQKWSQDQNAVFARLETVDPETAALTGPNDRQRILRAIEVFERTGTPISAHRSAHERATRYDALMFAPQRDRADLYARIDTRVERMFAAGLVEEVRALLADGVASDSHAFKAIGYREVAAMLRNEIDLETAKLQTKQSSRRLAKKQLTWLRQMDEAELHWVPPIELGGADKLVDLWDQYTRGKLKS